MQAPDTSPTAPPRRDDAGTFKITDRDITGLELCAEQYGAPYDLLAAALDVTVDRLRGITARWRHAGYATTGSLGRGPAWCWLTPAGMRLLGRAYPAQEPSVTRLAHIRAVLAVRLWLEAGRGLPGRAGVVAQRTPHPRRRRRPGRDRAHPRRRSALAVAWTTPPTAGRSGPSRPS